LHSTYRHPGELERVVAAGEATLRACIELGGSITGEHGIGLEKRPISGCCSTYDLAAMMRVRKFSTPIVALTGKAISGTGKLWRDSLSGADSGRLWI
jgi:hypothetical protein